MKKDTWPEASNEKGQAKSSKKAGKTVNYLTRTRRGEESGPDGDQLSPDESSEPYNPNPKQSNYCPSHLDEQRWQ